jgi:hypothetical protein
LYGDALLRQYPEEFELLPYEPDPPPHRQLRVRKPHRATDVIVGAENDGLCGCHLDALFDNVFMQGIFLTM